MIFVPEATSIVISFTKFVAVQTIPLSVETKTPSLVPANIFVPQTAKEWTLVCCGMPVLVRIQFVPLFVERYISALPIALLYVP